MHSQDSYFELLELLFALKHAASEAGASRGIATTQTMALLLMDDPTGRPINYLSQKFGCDASNMTGIIDGLEHKKLVKRCEHPSDRRIKLVTLTRSGRKTRLAILQQAAAFYEQLRQRLEPNDQLAFDRIVNILTK